MEINNFVVILLITWQFVNVQTETSSCHLLRTDAEGFCVPLKECQTFVFVGDFVNPDRLAELNERMSSCLHEGSGFTCCEKRAESTLAPSRVSPPTTTSTTPAPPNNIETPFKMHKNFKLFDKNCGDPEPFDRVAFGEDAGLLQNPWAVRLGYKTNAGETTYNCGGTLITDRYVLTAAHCITNLKSYYKLDSVRLGEYDATTNPDCNPDIPDQCADPIQDVTIESIVPHPSYSPITFVNDIGIIRLSKAAKIEQNNIQTICLPFDENLNRITPRYDVIGWGATENATSHHILQIARSIPGYDLNDCEEKFAANKIKLTEGQVCAGGEGKTDSCRGDSGGSLQSPAILDKPRFMQFGIVSFGVSKCDHEEGIPGIYTKVSKYLNWIMDNMK